MWHHDIMGDSAYLDEQKQVRVLTLGRRSVTLPDVVSLDVDTLHA